MDNRNIKQYFDKKKENVDPNVFEIEENSTEIVRMKIEDFKDLAKKAGLLNEDKTQEEKEPDPEEILVGSFEVVED